MSDCKLCAEKDKHLADLQSHVDTLKNLLFVPKVQVNARESEELNSFLSGEDLHYEETEDQRQASRVLSGDYEDTE